MVLLALAAAVASGALARPVRAPEGSRRRVHGRPRCRRQPRRSSTRSSGGCASSPSDSARSPSSWSSSVASRSTASSAASRARGGRACASARAAPRAGSRARPRAYLAGRRLDRRRRRWRSASRTSTSRCATTRRRRTTTSSRSRCTSRSRTTRRRTTTSCTRSSRRSRSAYSATSRGRSDSLRCSRASPSSRRRSRSRACCTDGPPRLLAAALVAASSTLVEYSTNARGYTLVALATVLVFLAAARALDRDSVGAWAVVAVVGALGLYAVPIMVYPLGGVFVWILVVRLARAAAAVGRCCSASRRAPRSSSAILTLAPVCAGLRRVRRPLGDGERVRRAADAGHAPRPGPRARLRHGRTRGRAISRSPRRSSSALGLLAGLAATPWISRFRVPVLLTVAAWAVAVLAVAARRAVHAGLALPRPARRGDDRRLLRLGCSSAVRGRRERDRPSPSPSPSRARCSCSRPTRCASRARRARCSTHPRSRRFLAERVEPERPHPRDGLRHDPRVLPRARRASTQARSSMPTTPSARTYVVVNVARRPDDRRPARAAGRARASSAHPSSSRASRSGAVYLVTRPT